jgi:type IV pilus assembly protein PilN
MRVTLNLASQPYVDVRSILKRLRVLMLVLAVLAVPLWFLLRAERGQAATATARVHAMQNNVRRLEQQQQSYQELMQQPQNAAVLTQSEFLNGLFRHKAFSWTATMTDLETVLPTGVEVLSIDPEVAKNGSVVIHLRVSGARDRAVELVRNLEKSRHFVSPRLTGEALAQTSGQNTNPNAPLQPVSASTAVNFDILAAYRPLSASEDKQNADEHETKAGKKTTETGSDKVGARRPARAISRGTKKRVAQ